MRLNNHLGKTFIVLVVLAFIFMSCTSHRLVNPQPQSLHNELNAGDTVRIVTKEGRHVQFKIVEIRADSIFSQKERIAFGEIAKIEKQKVDAAKTTGAVILGAAGVLAVGYF
jgi:preprotein translocase subunit YajC